MWRVQVFKTIGGKLSGMKSNETVLSHTHTHTYYTNIYDNNTEITIKSNNNYAVCQTCFITYLIIIYSGRN